MGEETGETGGITGGEEAGRFDACEEAEGRSHGVTDVSMLEMGWTYPIKRYRRREAPMAVWGYSTSEICCAVGASRGIYSAIRRNDILDRCGFDNV